MTPMLRTEALEKSFTLHLQGGVRLAVLRGVDFTVHAGECVALSGPSGAGKSTLLRALYGNYRADAGHIWVGPWGGVVAMPTAPPRSVLDVRNRTLGYVSQFLRVVPRVPSHRIVAEAADGSGARATELLLQLNIPEKLHALPPATFSGGEQQRVNLARGFAAARPILLLDEPTASLDAANAEIVVGMIREAKARGTAVVGIFHDTLVRNAVADRCFEVGFYQDTA
jgi:alpha-D-ribose 1-methylphosphonate 5-triphosphate synthase subunit PhnL